MLRKTGNPETVDLSSSGITSLSQVASHASDHVTQLSLNHNELYTLEGISSYTNLQKLTVQHNHLVDLTSILCLDKLTHLDLQDNSLTDITAIGDLLCLKWVCLAGNSIQHYNVLSGSQQLQHIDLSNNCISQLEDVSNLHQLTELFLSGNIITELNRAVDFLPRPLSSLSLSDNEVSDISQLVKLSCLPHLQRLSLSGNPFLLPCHQLGLDYKPIILYCCTAVKVLDGVAVVERDRMLAANIFTQGMELHRMTQANILQQLMQQKCHGTKSPLGVQYPSNVNTLLSISQRSPASHDVTAGSPTLYNFASNENVVRGKSPQLEHTTPILPVTNGDVCDFQSLPSDGVAVTLQQQQWQENRSLPQRKRDDLSSTKATSQLHSVQVDAALAKKVVIVQAHIRGHLTRKHVEPLKTQIRAATTIQAYWRGCMCRKRDPVVIKCRAELDQCRMHRHILQLSSRLNNYQTELTHNAHMMQIQDETIRSLATEVEELQQWRDHMINQQRNKAAIVIQKYWRGYQVRKFTKVTMAMPHKLSTLWSMCQQLKSQVEELQHAMATMTTKADVLTMNQSSLPSAPSQLHMTHYSNTCLLLEWSSEATAPTTGATPTILGYRVYVNGTAEGQVGSNKRRAYLEGLDSSATYRITVRSVYAEGESGDSNPVIASLSNLSRESSMLISPQSSFPPSPEKSVVTMTIKEEDKVDLCDEEHRTDDDGVKQWSDEVATENVVDNLIKESSFIKEDTYSTHTTSTSSSSVDLNDPPSTVQKLRDTFTVVQESKPKGQHNNLISPQGNPNDTVVQDSSHDDTSQGNSHIVSEGNPQHNESKGTGITQGIDVTRKNPLDTLPDDISQPHSHHNSLESLHSMLTTSSSDSPVATPTGSHSPKFHQSVQQRRSFFPPILDFSEDKSVDSSLQNNDETATSSSKEFATQLLSTLEKELSNPLLKPTTCT